MTGSDLLHMSKAEGKAESVLTILSTKFAVPEELKEEIMSQIDLEILDRWVVLAAQAISLDAFLNSK